MKVCLIAMPLLYFFPVSMQLFRIINIWLDQYVNKCQIKINWFRILYIIQIYNVHVSWSFSIGIYKWVEFSVQSWLWRVICPTIYKSWRVDWVSGKKTFWMSKSSKHINILMEQFWMAKWPHCRPPLSLSVCVCKHINKRIIKIDISKREL